MKFADECGLTFFGLTITILAVVAASAVGTFFVVLYGSRAYGRPQCHRWSEQTGIKTKFVILGWADTGTCLAKTADGHWVLNSKWQAFVNATTQSR